MSSSVPTVAETDSVSQYPELDDAVSLLANLTDAYTVALFLADRGGQTLRLVAKQTLSRSLRKSPVAVGEGLVGYVYKSQSVVDVDRYKQNSMATGLYSEDEGIKAFLGMPVGGAGVLVVDSRTRRIFGEKEKKLVRDFAGFVCHLLASHRVRVRERQYGRILDLIYEVENAATNFQHPDEFYDRALAAGSRFTGLAMGFICLIKPDSGRFVVQAVLGSGISTLRGNQYPVNSGLVGWIIKNARPLLHGRVRPLKGKSYLITADEPIRGYDTFVGVPLAGWRRLMGVWAYAGSGAELLGEEEENGLMVAGHRVAATIEHYGLSQARRA